VHHDTTLSGYVFAIKSRTDNRKNLLNSNTSPSCPYNMVNFSPLRADIGWRVWGTLTNFNGFRVWASLLHRRRSPEVNQTLHYVWPSPGMVHYIIHFRGLLSPNRILLFSGAKFTLPPGLAFSYIGSITARHSSSGRQPNFAACMGRGRELRNFRSSFVPPIFRKAVITFGIGPHSSCRVSACY